MNEPAIHKHQGYWGCMDTQGDRDYLTKLVDPAMRWG